MKQSCTSHAKSPSRHLARLGGLASILGAAFLTFGCSADAEDVVQMTEDQQFEYEQAIAAQLAENSDDEQSPGDSTTVAKAGPSVAYYGTIVHGGSIGDDYHEYIVGGPCSPGYVRSNVTATHTGSGWGGVGRNQRVLGQVAGAQ